MRNTQIFNNLADKTLGGCRLIARIGKGAMGVVYLADQIDLQRKVAIKILDPKFSSDASYIRRFEMEARAAAQLNHPNIVKVYDFGSEESLHFIVNEFIDGGTVQGVISKRHALNPVDALDYAIQVARGLAAATQAGIIHRDIKPENLMLTSDGTLKIADFGLARNMTPGMIATDSGLIMGTPFYMSPEQAKGLHMDARSDIYSLGVSLYVMVIGCVPFDADSVVGVLLKHISSERPDPCSVKPDLPSLLGALIMRMMDKRPENRPQSPEELLKELVAVREILKPSVPPPSLADIPEFTEAQRQTFRVLAPSAVIRIAQVDVSDETLGRMLSGVRDDGGIAVATDSPFPPGTPVEVRYINEEKGGEISALGLVRWVDGQRMGISFIRATTRSATDVRLSGAMAINAITATPLHQRLLRLVYANAGQFMTQPKIASALGVGSKMADDPIRTFEQALLIKRHADGRLELVWPKDQALQREIVVWIERNGMQ